VDGLASILALIAVSSVFKSINHRQQPPSRNSSGFRALYSQAVMSFDKVVADLSKLSVAILFVLFLMAEKASIAYNFYNIDRYSKEITAEFYDWVACVFRSYDGISDDSWRHVCGEHSKRPYDIFPAYMALILSYFGSGIIASLIYSPSWMYILCIVIVCFYLLLKAGTEYLLAQLFYHNQRHLRLHSVIPMAGIDQSGINNFSVNNEIKQNVNDEHNRDIFELV
jgi:hypothetical protein